MAQFLSDEQLARILEEIEAVNEADKKETVEKQYTNLCGPYYYDNWFCNHCFKCGRPIDSGELVLPVRRHFPASDYDDIGFIHYEKEDCI